jgi:hypothetical protein
VVQQKRSYDYVVSFPSATYQKSMTELFVVTGDPTSGFQTLHNPCSYDRYASLSIEPPTITYILTKGVAQSV